MFKKLKIRTGMHKMAIPVLITLLFSLSSCYEMTVDVDRLPGNTPPDESIYITGNFNNWDPGDDRYTLHRQGDSVYTVTLPRGIGKLEYKFTRGDWTTVEKDVCGDEIPNRSAMYGNTGHIIDTIRSWNDLPKLDCPQITIVIDSLPDNTPPGSFLSLAGTINGWDPSGDDWKFIKDPATGKYSLTLRRPDENRTIEYKVTRGDLERAESDGLGNEIPARQLDFGTADTVRIMIRGWEDLESKKEDMLTILITKIPANSPPGDPIYITGNFNGWYPRQGSLILEKNSKGRYFINLPRKKGDIEFKFTRGGWSTVEKDRYGYEINNRVADYRAQDTLFVEIESWRDLYHEEGPPVRIVVENVPARTPSGDDLYLTGNFNNWNPGDPAYQLHSSGQGSYYFDLPRSERTLEFKVTRGSWQTVECQADGDDISNRSYEYKDINKIVISVEAWKDSP